MTSSPSIRCGTSPARSANPPLRLLASFTVAVAMALLPPLHRPVSAYDMPAEFYKLSEDVVSWHIPWAKPYAGGVIKALVIAPRGAQRETLELAQRLSMDYTYVLTLTPTEASLSEGEDPFANASFSADAESWDEMLRGESNFLTLAMQKRMRTTMDEALIHLRLSIIIQLLSLMSQAAGAEE